jgi:hypothetical protein
MLRAAMTDISRNNDIYTALFEAAPHDQFSFACFDSGQEGPGFAHAALIQKPVDLLPAAALSLLWSREFVFVEDWDQDKSKSLAEVWQYALGGSYMSEEFTRFVNLGVFSPMSPSVCRKTIGQLLQGVNFDCRSGMRTPFKSFSQQCSGKIASIMDFRDQLIRSEFIHASKITDDWNDQTFFFETDANIGYFSWRTFA